MNIAHFVGLHPISVTIFIITIVTSVQAFRDPGLMDKFIMHPYIIGRKERRYTLITSGLIHANWMHLFFNMFTFYFFAFDLEEMLAVYNAYFMGEGTPDFLIKIVGHGKFLLVYVGSMLAGNLSTYFRFRNQPAYRSLGASGAIAGLLFSFVMFAPKAMFLVMFFPCPAWLFAILYLGYSFYMSRQSGDGINHVAHLYGAIGGVVLTFLCFPGYFVDVIHAFLRSKF